MKFLHGLFLGLALSIITAFIVRDLLDRYIYRAVVTTIQQITAPPTAEELKQRTTMRFTFPWPIKPWIQTQAYGVYNPVYQRFGYSRHNGTDVALAADALIRSAFPGTVVRAATRANGLWEPAGGGIFISVLSDAEYSFDDGKVAYVLADYLHCDRLIQPEGEGVLTGTVLAVADNTGFSTGPHTHIQVRRVRKMPLPAPAGTQAYRIGDGFFLQNVDANDANGSFDPTPYFSKTYAADDVVTRQYGGWTAFWAAVKRSFLNP